MLPRQTPIALGLLGGTFNPVHIGHLRGAIELRETLGLDQVSLIPAKMPPLKGTPGVSAEHRARMAALAVERVPGLTVDTLELEREGPSFTVDTLQALRGIHGPRASLTFIMGADALPRLHLWHDWQRLIEFANIVVLDRPGVELTLQPSVAQWLDAHTCSADDLAQRPLGGVARAWQPPLAVSSTELRAALSRGKNVRFLLPDPVIEYITQHDLYSS